MLSLHRFKQLFLTRIEQYKLPDESDLPLMPSALEGIALDYYFDSIKGVAETVADAFDLLDSTFNSQNTRAQFQNYLESLTLAAVRESESCSTAKAFE